MDGLAIHISNQNRDPGQNFKILIMKSVSMYILVLCFEMGTLIAQTTLCMGTAPECSCLPHLPCAGLPS